MPVIKDNQLIEDPWLFVQDGESLEADDRDVVVTYERWAQERDALVRRSGRLGVRLASNEPPQLIAPDLKHLDLVAIDFPRFADGRGFSYARLLRERYGFQGEIRAVGDVLRDQMVFMQRCGITAFDVTDPHILKTFLDDQRAGAIPYQPAADTRPWAARLRAAAVKGQQPNAAE